MFSAIAKFAAPVAKLAGAQLQRVVGKRTAKIAGATIGTVGATRMLARTVPSGVAQTAVGGVAGVALGQLTAGRRGPPRRRRRRRFPTALQMARYEQAQDILKGHPGAPAMRKMLAWKFFSRYSWI